MINSELESINCQIVRCNRMIEKYSKILEYFEYYLNGANNNAGDLDNIINVDFSYGRFANVLDGDSVKTVTFDMTRSEISEYKKFYIELLHKMENKLVSLYQSVQLTRLY